MRLLVDVAIRTSAVLLIGLLFERLLARRSAAVRHCVLAAALAAAAAVIPLSLVVPPWEIPLPAPAGTAVPAAHVPEATAARSLSSEAPASNEAPEGPDLVPALVAAMWAVGFAAGAAVLLAGVWRLRRISARAKRLRDPRWISAAAQIAAAYGLRRSVMILQTDAPGLLATWGVLQPRVLLPSHAREWSADRIHVVLCHELAHIRRRDWLVQMAAELLRTACWFNPLVWIACTRLRRASEQACDDVVLAGGVPASDYAAHLLDLVRKCRTPGFHWVPGTPMARPSTLERRISAMLNSRLDHRAISRRARAVTAALLVSLTLPAAALRGSQSAPAPLSGSVYDATGGVLPQVDLTLENNQGIAVQATTDRNGRFQFPSVGPGRYVLAASLAGFRPLRHEFELRSARDWDRAITLQVGELKETVVVSESRAAAPKPPATPNAPQPVRIGGNVRAPRKVLDVHPVYPESMRSAGREGIVPVEAIIGRDGTVISVRVLSAQVHPDFAVAAVDAVRQWRFDPTLLNGAPVEVAMRVSVEFNLSE